MRGHNSSRILGQPSLCPPLHVAERVYDDAYRALHLLQKGQGNREAPYVWASCGEGLTSTPENAAWDVAMSVKMTLKVNPTLDITTLLTDRARTP